MARPLSPRQRAYFIADRQRLIALYTANSVDAAYIAKLAAQLAALLEG